MEHYKFIAIEKRMRSLAGHCERGEYGIDADMLGGGIASWYMEHHSQLPVSVVSHPVIQKWSETFSSLYHDGDDLSDGQIEGFFEEFMREPIQ